MDHRLMKVFPLFSASLSRPGRTSQRLSTPTGMPSKISPRWRRSSLGMTFPTLSPCINMDPFTPPDTSGSSHITVRTVAHPLLPPRASVCAPAAPPFSTSPIPTLSSSRHIPPSPGQRSRSVVSVGAWSPSTRIRRAGLTAAAITKVSSIIISPLTSRTTPPLRLMTSRPTRPG